MLDIIYKRFDKIALKSSIYDYDTEDDDDHSNGRRHGLSEDEKIAVGVCVTVFFLALIALIIWCICRNKQDTPQSGQFGEAP